MDLTQYFMPKHVLLKIFVSMAVFSLLLTGCGDRDDEMATAPDFLNASAPTAEVDATEASTDLVESTDEDNDETTVSSDETEDASSSETVDWETMLPLSYQNWSLGVGFRYPESWDGLTTYESVCIHWYDLSSGVNVGAFQEVVDWEDPNQEDCSRGGVYSDLGSSLSLDNLDSYCDLVAHSWIQSCSEKVNALGTPYVHLYGEMHEPGWPYEDESEVSRSTNVYLFYSPDDDMKQLVWTDFDASDEAENLANVIQTVEWLDVYDGPSYITLDPIEVTMATVEPIEFTGVVSPNALSIQVIAEGGYDTVGTSYYDDYTLTSFAHGDQTFTYRAAERWNNLAPGENKYTFVAHFDDGTQKSTVVEIIYKQ
jgi:hypothetical protein